MTTKIVISINEVLPYLLAYQEGVYSFKFVGDTTYTDDQGVAWNWVGVGTSAPLIVGVRGSTGSLLAVNSLQDCIDNDGTWYYEQDNDGRLYVHWANSAGDWSEDRRTALYQKGENTVSNNYHADTFNFEDGVFYVPSLNQVSQIGFKSDPLKLGLIGEKSIDISIANKTDSCDDVTRQSSRGAIAQVLFDDVKIFQGFTSGAGQTSSTTNYNAIEQRFFSNSILNRNLLTTAEFADLDSKYVNKGKPVSFGDIAKGQCIPVNSSGVKKGDAANITFIVSDPALGPMRAITKLFDSNDNEVTISSTDLTACTVTYAKPAGDDIDLGKFRFEGQGHELGFGSYNNGLDIIRFCFDEFAGVPYLSSTYDQTQWQSVTDNNTQAVGITVFNGKGFTEEIIEPVATSLQVDILTKGEGTITAVERDTSKDPVLYIDNPLISNLSYEYNTDAFVSELIVQYQDDKETRNTDFAEEIETEYGDTAVGQINPVKTILYNESDADSLSDQIMETSKEPEKRWSFNTTLKTLYIDILPFDLIWLETCDSWVKIELLSITHDVAGLITSFTGREIEVFSDCLISTDDEQYLITTDDGNFYVGC